METLKINFQENQISQMIEIAKEEWVIKDLTSTSISFYAE